MVFVNVNGISSKKILEKGYYEDLTIVGETSSDVNVARISNVMWRSTFQIQVLGTEGYGIIEGRVEVMNHKNILKMGLD